MDATDVVLRARCDGHDGYRNGRKHLVAIDRLVNPTREDRGRHAYLRATGPCPVCGAGGHIIYNELGPADRTAWYLLVGIKVVWMPEKLCNASCRLSASAECKCSCGGGNHGMHA